MSKSQEPNWLIHHDPDWINSEKYSYSLDKLALAHPEGVADRVLASVLMIHRDEVEPTYKEILEKLRLVMGVEVNDDE